MPHPTLVLNRPYSTLVGLVAGEQALQLSHTHPLFRDDNQQFYGILEKAVRGTVCETTIKPFQRLADGRCSYLALIAQHAGQDKWIVILRTAKEYMNNRKWDGTTATTMQAHIVPPPMPEICAPLRFLKTLAVTGNAGRRLATASSKLLSIPRNSLDMDASLAHNLGSVQPFIESSRL